MQTLWQDLRYGARMMMKKPGFSLTAVVTLALGIGATTAIFTVVNAVLLRPLPYPDADRLVYVGQTYRGEIEGSGEPKFLFWREQSQSFEALACYSSYGGAQGNLAGGDEAEYVRGLRVSEDFFRALGVFPALGRAFTHAEDTPGGARMAILSHGLWQRRFGGRKDILGQTVSFNDQPMTIVGIMPPQFRFGSGVDLFTPMQARRGAHSDPNAEVVGRLKPGVAIEQAHAELKVIAEKYRAAFPRDMQDGESAGAQPYQELFVGDLRRYLWILLGAGGFLLLIACANVANLQLVRAAARRREIAVRMALGAGGGRIARQLLAENALLALVGGAAGALLAVWGTDGLIAALPEGLLPSVAEIKVDWRVLVFAFGAAIVTGLLFGLAPAWQSRRVDVNSTLKEGGNKGGSARGRLRGALVVAEVALSLTLLVGAGLLTRTFANLMGVAPGFDPRGVLTCQVVLDGPRYDTTQEEAAFYRDALERISRLPGVEAAAVINKLPLDWQFNMPVILPEKPDQLQSVQFRIISPDYFRTMKIAVRQGRAFTDADNAAAPPVIIVNEAFTQRFFDGRNSLARRISIRGDAAHQVVGVVADVKQQGLDRAEPPMVFIPIPQMPDRLMAIIRTFTPSYFTIRATGAPRDLVDAVRREIASVDATLAVSQIHSMDEILRRSIASQRFNMLLVGLFAGLGLLLAGVGIYGVVSYSVAERTNEIAVRIALGARAADVVMLVLKQGLALAALGVAIGLSASLALTRLMKGLLFGVSAADPLTFVAIALLLVGVALMAALVPAGRAAKVDPMAALRRE
ncbi:MAG TPA: ABC transporter permease [Blastocatellia bacterium]|jgi:predicted permease|nr:ABC transporter permease [Blastocatellia bacterium]